MRRWKPADAWGWLALGAATSAFLAFSLRRELVSAILGLASALFSWLSAMDAEDKAGRLQTEIDRLKALNAGRTIEPNARLAIIDALRTTPPDGPVHIQYSSRGSSREPWEFAKMLRAVLEEAGWNVATFNSAVLMGPAPEGIVIRVGPGAMPARAIALRDALRRGGLRVEAGQSPEKPGTVKLFVGHKPRGEG